MPVRINPTGGKGYNMTEPLIQCALAGCNITFPPKLHKIYCTEAHRSLAGYHKKQAQKHIVVKMCSEDDCYEVIPYQAEYCEHHAANRKRAHAKAACLGGHTPTQSGDGVQPLRQEAGFRARDQARIDAVVNGTAIIITRDVFMPPLWKLRIFARWRRDLMTPAMYDYLDAHAVERPRRLVTP